MNTKSRNEWNKSAGIQIRGGNSHLKDYIYIDLDKPRLIQMGFLKDGAEPDEVTASKVRQALKINVREEPGDRFGPDYFLQLSIGDIEKEYPMETYWYESTFGKNPAKLASWLRNVHLTIRPGEIYEDAPAPRYYVLGCPIGGGEAVYCLNRSGDWTTHIEDAFDASRPDIFTYILRQNFADNIGAKVDDLEIMSVEKFEGRNEGDTNNAEIKGAVRAAWSAAKTKNFKLNILDVAKDSNAIDVYPRTMDGELCGVSWRILPDVGVIARYADNLNNGTSEVIAELNFKDADDVERIFMDEFESLDETLQIALDNGGW